MLCSVDAAQRTDGCVSPPEMSMRKRSRLYTEATSSFETWLVQRVLPRVLEWIPTSVSPNTISLTNHVVCWTAFVLGVAAPYLRPASALWFRVLAGLLLGASMLLDCLDGMQARRTNRCSKLGEVLDHSLDSINIPLGAATILFTLGLDPWTIVAALITNVLVYNSQLVLYHHTGKFVAPPNSGAGVQAAAAGALIAIGAFFFFFPRELAWVGAAVTGFAWLCIAVQGKVVLFFAVRLGRQVVHHLKFVGVVLAVSAAYLLGWMSDIGLAVMFMAVSFRITGSFVLYSVLGRRYSGLDQATVVWLVGIALANLVLDPITLRGFTLQAFLPYLAAIHLAGLNLIDIARHLHQLRPAGEREVHRVA